MKKITLLFILCAILTVVHAQIPPQAFNYSAVARDAEGDPIANTTIGIQISIKQTTALGPTVYQENHFVNTDEFGLFNLIVGGGAIQSGAMEDVSWAEDNFYLQVGMDANGGTNFLTMGTAHILSVPYALHAATTDSVAGGGSGFSGDYEDLINKPITISSISSNGDTLYLSNGQYFVSPDLTSSSEDLVQPTITTDDAIDITSNGAILGGTISDVDDSRIVERGIVYSTSPNPSIYSNKIIIGSGTGSFNITTGYNAFPTADFPLLESNTTFYVRAYAVTENNISFYGNEVDFTTLPIGQTGPGGGIVFFDKGNNDDGWQYLETAPSDQSTGIEWGCDGTLIGGTSEDLGSGANNTALIIAGCNDADFAAKICADLTLGGQTDWFLPSFHEYRLMHFNLHINSQGNFSNALYWSSSEGTAESAATFHFNNDYGYYVKTESNHVRAIRAY